MNRRAFTRAAAFALWTILSFSIHPPASAASPYYKDVCSSGCTYSNLQTAIDSITDSSATKVYTVFIDSGVLQSSTPFTTSGKSYINFVGRGMGTSVIQAIEPYFTNVSGSSAAQSFLDLTGSTNVSLRDITIDARTKDPGTLNASVSPIALNLTGTDKVVVERIEATGENSGIADTTTAGTGLIQVFDSKIRGITWGVRFGSITWHIFSSDIRAVDDGTSSVSQTQNYALGAGVSATVNSTIWGSHLHAESSRSGTCGYVAALAVESTGGSLTVIGSTVHVKIDITNPCLPGTQMYAIRSSSNGTTTNGKISFIGTQILYENAGALSQGKIGGLITFAANSAMEYDFYGSTFIDGGGTGGVRSDIDHSFSGAPTVQTFGTKVVTTANNASGSGTSFDTLSSQKGTATFPGTGTTLTVNLPKAMPDTNYRVAFSANAPQTIYVSAKTTSTFTLTSSVSGSTATIDWILAR